MNVLVTGATGYLGGHLTKELVKRNEAIDALVRRPESANKLSSMGVGLIEGDLTDTASYRGKLGKYDLIYHLANVYGLWVPDRSAYYDVNVQGTRAFLLEAKNAGAGRIVYTSTMMALGTKKGEMGTERTEHCGYNTSEYGRSKYLGLCEVQKLVSEGAPVVTTIPGTVFGPGDKKTLGPGILRLLNGRVPGLVYPEAVFGYTYIDDAVKGHLLAAKNGEVGERYIISNGNYSSQEIFDMVADIAGVPRVQRAIPPAVIGLISNLQMLRASLTKRAPEFPRDMVNGWKWGGVKVDNSRSISELGITYTPMEQALKETVEWYRANGLAPPAPSR